MSGHNKWSTIKRRKGAQDAKRGKVFSRIIKEITVAARLGGGDADGNPRLRRAIDEARANNMPNDNIDRAIKKGTGELEGVEYEELLYEGIGPNGALVMIEVMTDNRNRTAAEVRKIFDKNGGELGQSGSAGWAFEQKGVIRLPRDAATEEQLFETAVGAGAEDLSVEDDSWVVTTPREELDAVRDALSSGGVKLRESGLEQIPNVPKVFGGDDGRRMLRLLDDLDDHDDVQNVFSDFEPDDALMAELEAE
ncbi:MAG TPA: YebC/PmpR family DNA-binding transcriptional regulator [Sandaracinaceae bacterium LLY-WYZ-13_1]|nr:YebC/PmpR family DNA-binding transcriptional regulator [Sandaracinaceae bacterium LLY-WYZ-13_1]